MRVAASLLSSSLWLVAVLGSAAPLDRPEPPPDRVEEPRPSLEFPKVPVDPAQRFRTFAQIVTLMEESDVSFSIGDMTSLPERDPERLAARMWPAQTGDPDSLRAVKTADGFELRDEACPADLMRAAETLYREKRLAEAEVAYLAAAKASPTCASAVAFAGDCERFRQRFARALELYDMAIAIDPRDARLHFFRGATLLRAGKPKAARESLIEALTLRPRYWAALQVLESGAREMGIEVHDERFLPQALARWEGDVVHVYAPVGPDAGGWLGWASCQALHLAERRSDSSVIWTSDEELECVLAYLGAAVGPDGKQADPLAKRLNAIADQGLIAGWALYEIGSRISQMSHLTVPDESLALVRRYVETFVVTKTGE